MHNYSCGASFTSLLYHANETSPLSPPPSTAAAPGAPSGSSEDPPARASPPQGALPRRDRARFPQGLPASPGEECAAPVVSRRHPPRPVPGAACGAHRASPAGGQRRGHRAAPSPVARSSPGRGQDGGLRCTVPAERRRQLRRGAVRARSLPAVIAGLGVGASGKRCEAPYLEPGTIPRKLRRGGRAASSRSRGRRAGVQARRGIRRREAAGAPRTFAASPPPPLPRGAPAAGGGARPAPALPSPALRSSLTRVEC